MADEKIIFSMCGVGKTLLMGHPYHASLRRVGEDYFIPTCPIIPVQHEDIQPIPTFFQPGQHVAIRRDGQDVTVTAAALWNEDAWLLRLYGLGMKKEAAATKEG